MTQNTSTSASDASVKHAAPVKQAPKAVLNTDELEVNSSSEKRALSYASTLYGLFNQILDTKQPADRVLANYFREHKKHGSKDRRVIRESLFGLFRWWGWGQQLSPDVNGHLSADNWFMLLSSTALLEQHSWQDIRNAWQGFAKLKSKRISRSEQALTTDPSVNGKLMAFKELTDLTECKIEDLLPKWFWQHCHINQEDTLPLIEAMSSRPPLWARVQKQSRDQLVSELAKQGIEATVNPHFSDAFSLGFQSINLNEVAQYKQGKIEVQDLGSQVIGQICQPKADEHWWDTCSGAGGKTLQLRSLMYQQANSSNGESGSITSSDIRSHALEELKKRAARAKFAGISIAKWQSDALPVKENVFDGVLVDAPCSCTGTWRRNPDMRWIDTASAIEDKPVLQLDILTRSSKAVTAGGQLVYATCSLAFAENQAVVNDFLANNSAFELLEIAHPFNGKASQMLTVWPQEANSDGMFVAKMVKAQSA
ncbi:RsmB/NOP family class I SAM-dependent RNA methyltransferase [Shewanella sp.]|uniref:RsmB/NOP family class I SAM-dependent RNA methyltransferase n=1 Tax=Shewanella sp. TaxID=50422 RepID=UPI004053D8CC